MDIQNHIDVQCTKIANGLAALKDVMGQPLACKVLELKTNLDSGKELDQLIRLERSLLHYLERKGDLLYVGFMGHFSSGKSSTINSLLGLRGSSKAREVDLNPTDKAITLLAHPQNSKSLIGLKSEGSIPVRTDFIEHDLLKNIVLADTPGSGDPLLLNEMVRDFLPVCDIILYFLSAASPFTVADTPMLKAKTKELPFIPMKFVITRGDEFRRNKAVMLSQDNFDASLAEKFLEEVILRVGKILGENPNKTRDIIIIDNECRYNIDHLINFLVDQSDTHDSSKRVVMHGHKVAYFISHSQDIQLYFKELLDLKTDVLKKIVDHAKLNIARYQDKVQITNNKLTESWIKNLSLMNDVRGDLIRKFDEAKQGMVLSANPFDEEKLAMWHQKIASGIEASATSRLSEIVRDLEQHASQVLMRCFHELRSTLSSEKIDKLKLSDVNDSGAINFKANPNTLELNMPYGLERQVAECQDILSDIVHDKFASLITGLNSHHSRLVALQPLKEFGDIISRSVASLEDDIKTYFDNVYVYRSGVFAIQVREAISKLGIEKELDEVESEFKEDFKEQVTREAKDQIFPEANVLISAYTLKLRELLDSCKGLRDAAKSFEIKEAKPIGQSNQILYDEPSWLKVIDEYGNQVTKYVRVILKRIYAKLESIQTNYFSSLKDLKNKKRRRFRKITLAFGALGLIAFLLLRMFNYVPSSLTLAMIVVIGIVSSLSANLIGYAVARITDKSEKRVVELRSEYEKKLLSDCQEMADIEIREFNLSPLNSQPLLAFLQAAWTAQAETHKAQAMSGRIGADYTKIRSLAEQYVELTDNYRALVDEMSRKLTKYFSDIDSNLGRLQKISKSISTVAIEPSFQLLDTTHHDLLRVSETIATTTFV